MADYFVQKQENGNYEPSLQDLAHVQETLQLLSVMTNDHRFEEVYNEASDAQKGEMRNMCEIDVVVHVYNINPGHRLPDCCRPLENYSQFVSAYRDRITSVGAEQAANEALDSLPDGEVKNYILSQKGEVIDMLLTEYDEEETLKVVAEDARAEGQREGEAIGLAKGEAIGVAKGRTLGEDRLASLVSAMLQSGADHESILKASTDSGYREEMYSKYHIE